MLKITVILCSILAVTSVSCSKKNMETQTDDELYKNSPGNLVPAQLANGVWFSGTISAISYWDINGHNLGNDHEAGREYQFQNVNGQGRMKFYQYLGTRNASNCIAEYFTYKEGTVVFTGDKFTFYPLKGNFKTIKKDCSSGNATSVRNAEREDLETVTYRWEIKNIENKAYLYTYMEEDIDHENVVFIYQLSN